MRDDGFRHAFGRIGGFILAFKGRRGRLPVDYPRTDVALVRQVDGAVLPLRQGRNLGATGWLAATIHRLPVHHTATMQGGSKQTRRNEDGQKEKKCQQALRHVSIPVRFIIKPVKDDPAPALTYNVFLAGLFR
jgi:hypothetical protein